METATAPQMPMSNFPIACASITAAMNTCGSVMTKRLV